MATLQSWFKMPRRSQKNTRHIRRDLLVSGLLLTSFFFSISTSITVSSHEICGDDVQEQGGQMGLAQCEDRNFKESDGELNRLYKSVYRHLAGDPLGQKNLIKEEREWISSRDRECKNLADEEDVIGSTRDYVMTMCAAEKTADRVKQLKARDVLKNPNRPLPDPGQAKPDARL